MNRIVRFFKNALTVFKMYNINLLQQLTQQKQVSESGRNLLRQVVDEFNKLDVPSSAMCQLVDNDEKVIIKLLGVWAVIGMDIHSENFGTFTIYASKTWSSNWEQYTIPVDNILRFDKRGALRKAETPFMEPELYGYNILEYVLEVGKSYTPSKISNH